MKPTRILILLSMVLLALLLFVSAAAADQGTMVVASGTAVGDTQGPSTMDFKLRAFAPGSGELRMHVEGATDWAGTHTAEVLQVETGPAGQDPGVGWAGEVCFEFTESSNPDLIGHGGILRVWDSFLGPKRAVLIFNEVPDLSDLWLQVTSGHIVIR
jgi:hypothetical protein